MEYGRRCASVWSSCEKLPRAFSAPGETLKHVPGWLAEETDILKIKKINLKLEKEEWVKYRNHRNVGKPLRYS